MRAALKKAGAAYDERLPAVLAEVALINQGLLPAAGDKKEEGGMKDTPHDTPRTSTDSSNDAKAAAACRAAAAEEASALGPCPVLGPCELTEGGAALWMLTPAVPVRRAARYACLELGNECVHDGLMNAGVRVFMPSRHFNGNAGDS